MRFRVTNAHAVVDDRSHLAVEHFIWIGEFLFERRRNRHQLERRPRLVHIAHGAVSQRPRRNLFAQVRIERRPVRECQNFAGVRILDNYRARNRLCVMNRLIQFLLGDVLNILVDGQDQALARFRLFLDIGEPLPARIHRDEHLPRTSPQFVIEGVFDATLPGVFHPDRSHHLRRQIACGIKALRLFLKMDALQSQRLDALDGFVIRLARHPAKRLVVAAVGQHHIVIVAGNPRNQGNGRRQVLHFRGHGEG